MKVKVRVESHREAAGGKTRVSFTSRKPPQKPRKGKDGMVSVPMDENETYFNMDHTMPTEEATATFPVGSCHSVSFAPVADDVKEEGEPDSDDEEMEPLDRIRAAARSAKKKPADKKTEEAETE